MNHGDKPKSGTRWTRFLQTRYPEIENDQPWNQVNLWGHTLSSDKTPMKISTKGPDTPHPNRLGWRPCWACHSHRWVHCCSAAHARRSSSYAARKPPIWGLSKTEGIKEICQFKTKMMNRQICWCLWNKPIATPEKLRWNPKNCHVQSEIIFQTG